MRAIVACVSVVLALGCQEDNENAIDDDAAAPTPDAGASADGAMVEADMAAQPDPDMGGGGDEACVEACGRVLDCTAQECARFDPDSADDVNAACLEACAGLGAFAAVASGSETCADLVEFAGQNLGDDYSAACDGAGMGNPGREWEECVAFGAHFSECLLEACPAADPLAAYLPGAYASFCDDAVNGGQNPQDYQNIAQVACDNPALDRIVRAQYERDPENPDSGGLAPLCADGPTPSVEACVAACEVLGPCIPDDSDPGGLALRNLDRCVFSCAGADFVPDDTWLCAADAMECGEVFQCFSQQGPAPAGCDVYSARVAACTVEACGGVADVEETLARLLIGACGELVRDGAVSAEDVAATTAETPCDDAVIAGLVTYLTVDGPDPEDGDLARVCEEPANEPELCAAACARLAPCAPAEGNLAGLRDPAVCEYVCQVEADAPASIWECMRDAPDECAAVLQCIPMMGGG